MENEMGMEVANQLATLYKEMESDPTNLEKQVTYFRELSHARLDDFYTIADQVAGLKAALKPFAETGERLIKINELGDVSVYDYHLKGLNLTFDHFRQAAAAIKSKGL